VIEKINSLLEEENFLSNPYLMRYANKDFQIKIKDLALEPAIQTMQLDKTQLIEVIKQCSNVKYDAVKDCVFGKIKNEKTVIVLQKPYKWELSKFWDYIKTLLPENAKPVSIKEQT